MEAREALHDAIRKRLEKAEEELRKQSIEKSEKIAELEAKIKDLNEQICLDQDEIRKAEAEHAKAREEQLKLDELWAEKHVKLTTDLEQAKKKLKEAEDAKQYFKERVDYFTCDSAEDREKLKEIIANQGTAIQELQREKTLKSE